MNNERIVSVLCVVGARPNFTKIAPLMRAFKADTGFSATLLHTGQHYDAAMKQSFFEQLDIPEPDIDLGVGSGSHAVQTADVMKQFEPALDELAPDLVLVVGDVNSTIACALVAAKKHIPVVHVEAGLRSGDRSMPEEINRVLTDQLSDFLFTTERSALDNLVREGIAADKVHFVGNVMIDTLYWNLDRAVPASENTAITSSVEQGAYGVVTMHRPSNVDNPETLKQIMTTLIELSNDLPLIFPVHPRTQQKLSASGLMEAVEASNIQLLRPQAYLEMLGLMKGAKVVLTDSGGLQEETTALGIPCITMRENTERPITIEQGTNVMVGADPEKIREAFYRVMDNGGKAGRIPEFWDGHAAERIVATLKAWASGVK